MDLKHLVRFFEYVGTVIYSKYMATGECAGEFLLKDAERNAGCRLWWFKFDLSGGI